jgi:hypothetical protein
MWRKLMRPANPFSAGAGARKFLAYLAALILLLLCDACARSYAEYEVKRVSSPNGKLEVTLTETNGGAVTSFGYEIRVGLKHSRRSQAVASLYGAVRNAESYGVNLSWSDDHTLLIQYLRAKAVSQTAKTLTLGGQQIRVDVRGGINDPDAPPGGMEYNRQKR